MPTWSGILAELRDAQEEHGPHAFDYVRRKYLRNLTDHTGRSVILYATQWTQPGADPSLISISDEDMQGLMEVIHGLDEGPLDIILHSPGGSPEAAEMLVHYLRSKFTDIRFFVPHAAMSAATMMCCAGDVIVMGKHSALGPIDPQLIIRDASGQPRSVPAQAVLDQFEEAEARCADPNKLGAWIPMLAQYGPSLLIQCENALKLARELVQEWLQKWMFAGQDNAEQMAKDIAKKLSDHQHFKSHSRHIPRAAAEQLGLDIRYLEDDQVTQDLVLSVFHTTTHIFGASSAVKIIENHLGKAFVKNQTTVRPQNQQQEAASPTP